MIDKNIKVFKMEAWNKFLLLLMVVTFVTSEKMNILYLMADDMRPNLGAYEDANQDIINQPKMHTPNLDALAARSIVFERAYVQQSLCSPSRTSSLTGRRPDTTRILFNDGYWREVGGNFTTLPQFFKERGYYSLGAGKTFHGGESSHHFDVQYSWNGYKNIHDPINDDYSHSWIAFNEKQLEEQPLMDTLNSDWLIDRLRYIMKDHEPPFFIGYGAHKPHTPLFFPEQFLDYYSTDDMQVSSNPYVPKGMPELAWSPGNLHKYKDISSVEPNFGDANVTLPEWKAKELRRAYYASISHADDEIGKVIDELAVHGLENDTIIIFWGDHGFDLGEHSHWCKSISFETTNRVPFMIHIPGVTNKGMRSSKFVEMVDIFPTLVELAGFDPLDRCPVPSYDVDLCSEGRSLLPLLEDQQRLDWTDTVFWQHTREYAPEDQPVPHKLVYSIRDGNYRYTEYVNVTDHGDQTWDPLWNEPADHEELYDLEIDPQERYNRYV